MLDLLGRRKDLDAVFRINGPSALGAISALEATGRPKEAVRVPGDGSQEGIAAIKAGKLLPTSAQLPARSGGLLLKKPTHT